MHIALDKSALGFQTSNRIDVPCSEFSGAMATTPFPCASSMSLALANSAVVNTESVAIADAAHHAGCQTVVAVERMHLVATAITAGTANFWSYSPKFGKATHFQRWKVSI